MHQHRVADRIYQVHGLRLETELGPQPNSYRVIERLTFRTAAGALAVSHSLRSVLVELDLVPEG